jgi:hypothetical protein
MLNYTEKTQNTYIQSRTVWEIVAIENCGHPLSPRTIDSLESDLIQLAGTTS